MILEQRHMAASFTLLNPAPGEPLPGISSFARDNVSTNLVIDQVDGTENTDATLSNSVPQSYGADQWTVATVVGEATNQLITPSTTSTLAEVDANVGLTNSYGVSVASPQVFGLDGLYTYAQSGAGTDATGRPPQDVWSINGADGITPNTIAVSITITYTPATGGPAWDNVISAPLDPEDPWVDGIAIGTQIQFQETALGITIVGPTAGSSLAITTPGTGLPPAYPGDTSGLPTTTTYVNFFNPAADGLSESSIEFFFQANTPAVAESIRYDIGLLTGVSTASTGSGLSQLTFHFGETIET